MERILLVEGEAIVALDEKQRLEALGYQVVGHAASGEEAVRIAQLTNPDLILMDIKIHGGMDGIETAARLRELRDIPVIFITAFSDEPTLERARITGSFDYLIKPFDDRELHSGIKIALYKHRMEQKLRESEERFKLAVRSSKDGIWDWDLTSGEAHYSSRWKTMLGLPEDQNISLPQDWLGRVHPDDIESLNQAIADLLQNKTSSFECEFRMMHQGGDYRWMLSRGLALFDAQKKPYRIAGSLSDITFQKLSLENEKRRRKEAELLQQAMFAINSSLDLQDVLDHILTGLQQAVPFDSAAITLIEGNQLKIVALGGTSRHTKELGDKVGKTEGLFALMENLHSPLILADAQLHPNYVQWSKEKKDPIHSWMGIPLIAYGHPIGFLMLNSQVQNIYTDDHANLARSFANQAAVAIEKARLFEQVRNGRERLQLLSKRLVEIQETERRLIAHELHDEIGQELTGLQFILALGSEGAEAQQLQAFKEAQALVSSLMSQVRELSLNLHPAMLDDLGLLPTLKAHFDHFSQQTGIHVRFDFKNLNLHFPADVQLSAFRVIQEALTNVARYAAVKEVEVTIFADEDSLNLRIEDHGRGFDMEIIKDSERSFGLNGIRERTFLAGGKLEISSSPGNGTRIVAIFPITDLVERRANDRQSIVGR